MIVEQYFAVEALFRQTVDYAGLFPPAGLPAQQVVANFNDYQGGPDGFALNRLVWPIAKLPLLHELVPASTSWTIAGLVSQVGDLSTVLEWNQLRHRPKVESLEIPSSVFLEMGSLIEQWNYLAYIECGPAQLPELEHKIGQMPPARIGLKLRTGGLQADAFPSSEEIFQFVDLAQRWQRPYKFTAGLHHLLQGEYPLNYEPGANCAPMHGVAQLLLACCHLQAGFSQGPQRKATFLEQLQGGALENWTFLPSGVRWKNQPLTLEQIRQARSTGCHSFGSCSFSEPLQEMRTLGWIV